MYGQPFTNMHRDNVVDLEILPDPDLSDRPDFQALHSFWQHKRQQRPVPLRRDIDPLELREHLGSLFLAEALPDFEDFRYRLIGTNLTSVMGQEYTGKTLRETFASCDQVFIDGAIDLYRRIVLENVIVRNKGRLIWTAKEYLHYDILHLPLSSDGTCTDMVMGKMLFCYSQ